MGLLVFISVYCGVIIPLTSAHKRECHSSDGQRDIAATRVQLKSGDSYFENIIIYSVLNCTKHVARGLITMSPLAL